MGKKRSRTSQTSKGERNSVNLKMAAGARKMRDESQPFRRILDQQAAWKKGKNVVLTIQNPNKAETNKMFIKVPAWQVWGNPNGGGKKKAEAT
tara:strand:- start:4946 stop:5224 length:279 start_codon:yes stop_codon:yes gene_type:complete